jgi:hypothetical protein
VAFPACVDGRMLRDLRTCSSSNVIKLARIVQDELVALLNQVLAPTHGNGSQD